MNTDLQTQRDTSQMTPIEIALQTDENGWISSKRLYEFLGLDATNYARWCEANIVNNPIFRENVDYEVFVIKDENSQGGRPSTEYMVTKDVAKYLAINSRSERGAEVRKYYLKVEDQTAQAIIKLQTIQNQLVSRVEQLGKFMEDKTLALEEKHTQLSEDVTHVRAAVEDIHEGKVKKSKWISDKKIELGKRIERLCHNHWRDGRPYTKEEMTEEIIRHMADEGIDFDRFVEEYKRRHNKIDEPYRLDVIFADGDLISAFEAALDRIDMGLTPDVNDDWDRMTEVFGAPEPDYDYDGSLSPIRRLSDGSVI